MSSIKDGFKFGVGFISVVLIAGLLILGATFLLVKWEESIGRKTNDTGVELLSVKHWVANEKLTFIGQVKYEGEVQWSRLSLSFTLTDHDGNFIGRCRDDIYRPFERSNTSEYSAICYDVPSDFEFSEFKFSTYGEY